MEQKKTKARRKVPDPGQRTLTQKLLHLIGVLLCVVLVLLGSVALVGAVTAKLLYDKADEYIKTEIIPKADFTLDGIKLNQSSFIYAYDKQAQDYVELRQLVAVENRVWVSYDEIPKDMINATVAIEDKRFWEHDGVDFQRTAAASLNMFLGGSTYGGSTLTQQLIKNLTQEKDVTVRRKINEIFRALEFEKHYSKEEIIQWYLNVIYLGEGAYGVQSAARTYFGKDLNQLTTKECACIVGITNNPSMYDPYLHPVANEKRTKIILAEMLDQGMLTQEEYDTAVAQELHFGSDAALMDEDLTCPSCQYTAKGVVFYQEGKYVCPNCGSEFDPKAAGEEEETTDYYTYFEDQVVRDVIADLMEEYGYTYETASQLVTTGGFRIYATVDLEVQAVVDSVYSDVNNIPATYSDQQMQSGIVVIDNTSGDIVAMYGGVGEKEGYLTLNRATQSRRPTGSSIKPVTVYGPALEYGIITPGSAYDDDPVMQVNGRDWPLNDNRTYSGWMVVHTGLIKSLNTIAVGVLQDLTPEKSFAFAKEKMGLYNLVEHETINGRDFSDKDYAPLALGQLTHGVTVREMAQAFATFPNKGVFRQARTYTRVEDSTGKVILDNSQETHQAMSEHAAWYMTDMLVSAVRSGTGTPAALNNAVAAGKTGTSSSNQDRWFNGFTPDYTASVWCGFDLPEEIRPKDWRNPACVLWKNVLQQLQANKEYTRFQPPTDEGLSSVEVCNHTGLLPDEACETTTVTLFRSDIPTEKCTGHGGDTVDICVVEGSDKEYLATEDCTRFHVLMESELFQQMIADGKSYPLKINTLLPRFLETKEDQVRERAKEIEKLKLETCPIHTKEVVDALEKLLDDYAASLVEPEPTEPSEPTEPTSTQPTDPTTEPTSEPTPEPTETEPTTPSVTETEAPESNGSQNGLPEQEDATGVRPGSDAWLGRVFRLLRLTAAHLKR